MITIEDVGAGLDAAIARRVRGLRSRQGLTIEDVAARSGVSRAMISKIERGEASPTAALLDRLCAGLGTTLSALFADGEGGPLARRADQPTWRDPGTGYVRRAVSAPGTGSAVEIVEVEFPAGARVSFEPGGGRAPLDQQIWVLEGGPLEITLGAQPHRLEAGDCLHVRLDRAIRYHNPGPAPVRYAVVIASPGRGGGGGFA